VFFGDKIDILVTCSARGWNILVGKHAKEKKQMWIYKYLSNCNWFKTSEYTFLLIVFA